MNTLEPQAKRPITPPSSGAYRQLPQTQHQEYEHCLSLLQWAVDDLRAPSLDDSVLTAGSKSVPGGETPIFEAIAELIIQSMRGEWRLFHTPAHIFQVGQNGDSIEVLAALFHDLAYVQVDHGIGINLSYYLAAFVYQKNGQLWLRPRPAMELSLPRGQLFQLVMGIFGLTPGQALTHGHNEFLSALVAVQCLAPLLPMDILAQISACIEATIPFRAHGESAHRLFERLEQTSLQFNLGWDEAQRHRIVTRAVRLANRDVHNFCTANPAEFLDNTWNLLPEINHTLHQVNSYSITQYRQALLKMSLFLAHITPDRVFQRYREEPTEAVWQTLLERTHQNLAIARLYLDCKLLSVGVLEALSLRLGPDVPLAALMGDMLVDHSARHLTTYLPRVKLPHQPQTRIEQAVMDLLEHGRIQSSSYDTKNSPVATYIIQSVGFAKAQTWLHQAERFFEGELGAEAFLASCDRPMIEAIIQGVQQVFLSRQSALQMPHL
jgi:hypothetical protein